MAVRSYQEPNGAAGERAGRVRGIRLWLRAYLVGLLLLLFAAAGTLAHLTIKHPPPPGISLGRQLEFVLALTVFEVGYQARALRLLGGLAKQGHSGAAFLAGFIYDTGNGVAEDPREAARWYHMAAESGHAMALNNLAALYMNGRGVSRDTDRAVALYQRAARRGDPVAQTNLGRLYLVGQGVPRIPDTAVGWFRMAAAQDHAPALYFLGSMQLQGWGLPQDREEARRWFVLASEAGSQEADRALADLGPPD